MTSGCMCITERHSLAGAIEQRLNEVVDPVPCGGWLFRGRLRWADRLARRTPSDDQVHNIEDGIILSLVRILLMTGAHLIEDGEQFSLRKPRIPQLDGKRVDSSRFDGV